MSQTTQLTQIEREFVVVAGLSILEVGVSVADLMNLARDVDAPQELIDTLRGVGDSLLKCIDILKEYVGEEEE